MLTHADFAQQYGDPFTSPIRLSILAVTERALTLSSHWLVAMETGWFGNRGPLVDREQQGDAEVIGRLRCSRAPVAGSSILPVSRPETL